MAKPRPKKYWTDHSGRHWKTPRIKDRLRPHQIKAHAALKAFVICRAGGVCQRCGSGEELVADHIISKRNGGTHHPDNLQCLCKRCNDAKSNFEDRGKPPKLPPGAMLARAGLFNVNREDHEQRRYEPADFDQ